MSQLHSDEVLLIVCKELSHFADEKLVTTDSQGELRAVEGASDKDLTGFVKTIIAQDQQNNTNSLAFIRAHILRDIQDLGWGTALGPAVLANNEFATIGDLVAHLMSGAFKL
jgi:hypothetical protein